MDLVIRELKGASDCKSSGELKLVHGLGMEDDVFLGGRDVDFRSDGNNKHLKRSKLTL